MSTDERRGLAVGAQIKRWRHQRELTLATVAERSGLNVGYLSQIENAKALPSLSCLASIGQALDVPVAWFFIDDTPPPVVIRAAERGIQTSALGRLERVDGGGSRDVSIVEAVASPGARTGDHAHAGDEHHIVLAGRFRMTQGDHVIEVGPGDYVRWDGTVPHDAEAIGDEECRLLIVRLLATRT